MGSSPIDFLNLFLCGDSQYVSISRTHSDGIHKSTTYKGPPRPAGTDKTAGTNICDLQIFQSHNKASVISSPQFEFQLMYRKMPEKADDVGHTR